MCDFRAGHTHDPNATIVRKGIHSICGVAIQAGGNTNICAADSAPSLNLQSVPFRRCDHNLMDEWAMSFYNRLLGIFLLRRVVYLAVVVLIATSANYFLAATALNPRS